MSMRRISIHAEVAGELRAHDVAVCARTPVAELLPALADTVGVGTYGGRVWRLELPTGSVLDESMSLEDNGVWDGDVIALAGVHDPPRGLLGVGPVRTLADTDETRVSVGVLIEYGWAALLLAAVIACARVGFTAAWLGAAIATAGCAAATSWRAVTSDSPLLAVMGVLGAGAAGALLVPAGPAAPNALLGAAVVLATSMAVTRFVAGSTAAMTATGAAAALVGAVAAVTIVWPLTAPTAGAALTVSGFGLLSLAPRCAALLTGVRPEHLVSPPPDLRQRACTAHATLTGLVVGSVVATVLGAALAARSGAPVPSLAFTAVTAVLLLVRTRTHIGAARRIALAGGGTACATTALLVVAASFPAATGWAAAGVIAAVGAAASARPGVTTRRVVDGLDYLCAALLIPSACWVIDLYAVARDWVFT
jgi:type VII secretion integral membrane protein EccD